MAGRLPDSVRWRRGKTHLGWAFTEALMEMTQQRVQSARQEGQDLMGTFLDEGSLRAVCRSYNHGGELTLAERVHEEAHLAVWLARNVGRLPKPSSTVFH
jgi:hypothetical protein